MSAVELFDGITAAGPPADPGIEFETACVLGGSIAGLLAARVLADHARQVVILERDTVDDDGRRVDGGVPQDRHLHTLIPAGLRWINRWLPGVVPEARQRGAFLVKFHRGASYLNDQRQVVGSDHEFLLGTRRMLESCVRRQVLALPNVSVLPTAATGLDYRDGAVSGVRHADGVLAADFVVDAMGRPSKLSDWLGDSGYSRPVLERLHCGINYTTGLFRRPTAEPDLRFVSALGQWSPPVTNGLAVGAVNIVEDDQWIVTLIGYDEDKPGRTIDEFRAICAERPDPFDLAVRDVATQDIQTYHQADSRRRNFTGLTDFPRRLVSVGDAVASFNPIYGQGMASSALHASCLSQYLAGSPNLDVPADDFFALQKVVVDAAWSVSAGGDAARMDAAADAVVPADVAEQRWAMSQIMEATRHDETVAMAFQDVAFMLSHPDTLGDPAVLDRALAVNQQHEQTPVS